MLRTSLKDCDHLTHFSQAGLYLFSVDLANADSITSGRELARLLKRGFSIDSAVFHMPCWKTLPKEISQVS